MKKEWKISALLLFVILFSSFVSANIEDIALKLNRLEILDGDANVDGKVDILDLGIIGLKYGMKEGDLGWDWKNDVANTVGEIDIYDLAEVSLSYGSEYMNVVDDPVFIAPSSKDVNLGDEFILDVNIDTPANVFAADVIISFNPAILEVLEVTEGDFLKKDGASTYPITEVNNSEGQVKAGITRFGVGTGVTGTGTLVTIKFKAKTLGTSNIIIDSLTLVDPDLNKILGIATENGVVNVNEEGNNAPTLSGIPDKNVNEDTMPPANWIDLYPYAEDTEDTDAQLTFSIESQSNSALINCNIAGNRYLNCNKPALNQFGSSDVAIKVTDTGGLSDTDTTKITVNSVNDLPTAGNDVVSTVEDTFVLIDVLINDEDVEGPVSLDIITKVPSHGTAIIESGKVKYTPASGYNGLDSFEYQIKDSDGATDTAIVNITVKAENDAPVAIDDTASVNEDEFVLIDVLKNDSDPDGDILFINKLTKNPSHGTAVIESGKVKYTPNKDYSGVDNFEYEVSDGMLTDTAKVDITVKPINDAPVIDSYLPLAAPTIDEETSQDFSVTASDIDSVFSIKWYLDSIKVGEGSSYTFDADKDSQGTYLVKVVVSDGEKSVEQKWILVVKDTFTRIILEKGVHIFSLPRKEPKSFNELNTDCKVVNPGEPNLAYYVPNAEDLLNLSNYVRVGLDDTLNPGQGYMIEVESECYIEMTGPFVELGDIIGYGDGMKEGWNMIGSTTSVTKFNKGNCQIFGSDGILKYKYGVSSCSEVEGYNGGYKYCVEEFGTVRCRCSVDNFEPGEGYWFRTANDCTFV